MVFVITKDDQEYFQCDECGLSYGDAATAQGCEEWCREHGSCNMDIIQYAIAVDGEDEG